MPVLLQDDMDDFINNEMGAIGSQSKGPSSKPQFGTKKPSMGMASKGLPSDFAGSSASKPSFGAKPGFAKKGPSMGGGRANAIDDLLNEEADILSGNRQAPQRHQPQMNVDEEDVE